MVNINLLPWREKIHSALNKKILTYCLILILIIILIFTKIYLKLTHENNTLQTKLVASKKLTDKITANNKFNFILKNNNQNIKKYSIKQTKNKLFTIKFESINLSEALQLLADRLKQNISLNQNIKETVSLKLHDISLRKAFDILLTTYHLEKYNNNKTWLIATASELIENQQNHLKIEDFSLKNSQLHTRIFYLHYANAEDIEKLFQNEKFNLLSNRGSIHANIRTNQLLITDIDQNLINIIPLIKKLDIPTKQVLIETKLASIDVDFERELGVDFSMRVEQNSEQNNAFTTNTDTQHFSLLAARLIDGNLLDVRLAAAENTGHGELISSPRLFTANRQTATIESGEEIPYQEISRSGATGVAFKKAVLSLKVTPQILPDKKVLLDLQINQDKPASRIVLGVPAITTRQLKSNVLAKDGETIVLGGIFETSQRDNRNKIPFLSTLPIIGLLFQQQNLAKNRRELLIFVTPHIID